MNEKCEEVIYTVSSFNILFKTLLRFYLHCVIFNSKLKLAFNFAAPFKIKTRAKPTPPWRNDEIKKLKRWRAERKTKLNPFRYVLMNIPKIYNNTVITYLNRFYLRKHQSFVLIDAKMFGRVYSQLKPRTCI